MAVLQQTFIECIQNPLYGIHAWKQTSGKSEYQKPKHHTESLSVTKFRGVMIDAQLSSAMEMSY